MKNLTHTISIIGALITSLFLTSCCSYNSKDRHFSNVCCPSAVPGIIETEAFGAKAKVNYSYGLGHLNVSKPMISGKVNGVVTKRGDLPIPSFYASFFPEESSFSYEISAHSNNFSRITNDITKPVLLDVSLWLHIKIRYVDKSANEGTYELSSEQVRVRYTVTDLSKYEEKVKIEQKIQGLNRQKKK